MIRLLYVLSGLAILLAGGIVALCARQWSQVDSAGDALRQRPSAMELFLERARRRPPEEEEPVSPLLAEADTFAVHLNPPVLAKQQPAVQEMPKPVPVVPVVRPPTASPKFKVCGTSCCDDQPQRSMALILEPGSNAARWVKRGTQVGHVIIQEIRPGSVLYLEGEQAREMAIEREAAATPVVADDGSSIHSSPPAGVQAEAARVSASTRRPTRARSMTVGSARTAALN
jgi:hypothetical protein